MTNTEDSQILMEVGVSFLELVHLQCIHCQVSLHGEYRVERVKDLRSSVKLLQLVVKL